MTCVAALAIAAPVHSAGRVFYDGFESGNTNLWQQDDYHDRCQVVTSAADGVAGPYAGSRMVRCNWNGTVAWNHPAKFQTLYLNPSYNNEIFYRARLRLDNNLAKTAFSPAKILRLFTTSPSYNDLFGSIVLGNGLSNQGVAGWSQLTTYWGDNDSVSSPSAWHKVEYYLNQSTNKIKVWHDGVLVRDDTVGFQGTRWSDFYLASNFEDTHDATNYVYFDEFEVFSDLGTGASGLMSNATISASAPPPPIPAPTNLRVTSP